MTTKNYYIEADYTDGGQKSACQETDFIVPEGVAVNFKAVDAATGVYKTDTQCYAVGPGGADPDNTDALVPSLNNCAAIGKVGENGKPFLVANH